MMNDQAAFSWECYVFSGLRDFSSWHSRLEGAFQELRHKYRYDVRGQTIRVWSVKNPPIRTSNPRVTYQDGLQFRRVALAHKADFLCVGVNAMRVFFEDGAQTPTSYSAHELFPGGGLPPVLRHEAVISEIPRLTESLNLVLKDLSLEKYVVPTVVNVADALCYRFRGENKDLTDLTGGQGFSKNLLQLVRTSRAFESATVQIGVATGLCSRPDIAMVIARNVVSVLRSWGASGSYLELSSGGALETFATNGGSNIVLLPLDGRQGDRPHQNATDWMTYLNECQVPFQICSISSNPSYSQHGLGTAILAKTGGILFKIASSDERCDPDHWFIGLDIGRAGQSVDRVVTLSLTDSSGVLKGYWRCLKNKTESLSNEALMNGLRWIRDLAVSIDGDRDFVLLRDGICPRDEPYENYRKAMGSTQFTLVEVVKRGNPLIHQGMGQPSAGTLLMPADADWSFLYPASSSQRGVIGQSLKFRAVINCIDLTPKDLATQLVKLCHASTLSFQPSTIPAPIQWSNGLCKLSYTDLQYAGWSHLPNKTLDLRA